MVSVRNILFAFPIVAIYLLSVIGVGRYSCHCEHSSQIAFFGIVTKCGCTHQVNHDHKDYKCVCGGELETKHHKNDDCCAVNYNFLKADQSIQDVSLAVILASSTLLLPQTDSFVGISLFERPLIKNYHALFRHWGVPIFKKNSQLLL